MIINLDICLFVSLFGPFVDWILNWILVWRIGFRDSIRKWDLFNGMVWENRLNSCYGRKEGREEGEEGSWLVIYERCIALYFITHDDTRVLEYREQSSESRRQSNLFFFIFFTCLSC